MKEFLKLIVLLVFLISYASILRAQEGYIIDGNIRGIPDGTVIVLSDITEMIDIDSLVLFDNTFHFEGRFIDEGPVQLWLSFRLEKKFYYANILMKNEHIYVRAGIDDFPYDVEITGSKINDEYLVLRDRTKALKKQRDSLIYLEKNNYRVGKTFGPDAHNSIWDSVKVIDKARSKIQKDFIISNFNTYAALSQLSYDRTIIPKDSLRMLYNTLDHELKESKWGKVIKVFFEEEIVRKGYDFYDFIALNQFGDTVKLSELMDDRFVFLDFSTAYCGACMKSVEELRQITRRYRDKVRVVRFSVDANKETWLRSVKRDDAPWLSLWEGKGTFGDVALKYAIRMLPTYFIIDPSGKIIDKGTGYGKGGFIQALSDNDIIDTKKK